MILICPLENLDCVLKEVMDVIEEWRDPCVRDGEPVTQEIIDKVDTAYHEVIALAREVAVEGEEA